MSNFHVVAELVFAPYHRYLSHLDAQWGEGVSVARPGEAYRVLDRYLREIRESLVSRAVESEVFAI